MKPLSRKADMASRSGVSVVIPTFNRAEWLEGTVRSAVDQTSPPEEVIVVDDGSTDRTREVCRCMTDDITYIRQENRGASSARNRGARAGSGRWIAFLDSDDRWRREKLNVQIRALRESEGARWSIADAELVGPDVDGTAFGAGFPLVEEGRRHGRDWFARYLEREELSVPDSRGGPFGVFTGDLFPILLRGNVVQTSALVVERSLFLEVGGFDEELDVTEDMDLALRLSAHPSACAVIAAPLYEWTLGDHDSLTSSPNTRRLIENALESVERARDLRGRWGSEEEKAFRAGRRALWRRLAYLHLSDLRLEEARSTVSRALAEGLQADLRMLAIWAASFLPRWTMEAGRQLKGKLGRAG